MTIVSCPKCNDQVTVPASAPRSARVRCPLCQEEYDLDDALAQLPPLLIVVSAAPVEEPALAAVGAMDAATGAEIGSAMEEPLTFADSLEPGRGERISEHVFQTDLATEKMVTAPTPAFRSQPRPKRKEKSMVGELVKIVLGGVVGIVLAILILWWGPGVDLGLAPAIAKVPAMRWILPPSVLKKADEHNEGAARRSDSESLEPVKRSNGKSDNGGLEEAGVGTDTSSSRSNALGGAEKSGSESSKSKAAAEPVGDFIPVPDPLGTDTQSSSEGGVGDLKIESPLKLDTKKPVKTTEPVKPKEATEPGEEKTTVEKPEPKERPVAATANLAEGIDAANSAAKVFDETDVADKEARRTAALALYNAYTGLGRAVEQANLEDADNAEQLPALRQTLALAANEPVKLNAIGSLAAKRLDDDGEDPGILLAGTVKDFKAAGSLFETTIELVKDKRLVSIVSAANPQDNYKVDDQVLILGSIVRDPKENLTGYEGEAPLVIKAGHAMVLPKEKPAE